MTQISRISRVEAATLPASLQDELQGQLRGNPLCLCSEDWLMEACGLAHVLADGFHHGEAVWEGDAPWLRFGGRMFLSLKEPSRRIQAKSV